MNTGRDLRSENDQDVSGAMIRPAMSGITTALRRALTVAAAVALFASSISAQENAGIVGQVKDSSGGVLPGVTVTVTGPTLQVPSMNAVTESNGEYRITPLPIGTYNVEYALQGFQTVRREGVRLTVGFTAKLDVVMPVGGVAETITVSGASPVIDVMSTTTNTRITRETIELLPSSRNSAVSLLAQAPGVRTVRDVGGSSLNALPTYRVFGQAGEPYSTLEGVWTNSLVSTGGSGNYWDYMSVEEASVRTIGNTAEVPTRGIALSAVIKSGSNQFHSTVLGTLSGKQFQSDNLDDGLRAAGITSGDNVDKRFSYSGDLGGRIVRDKLWFYASARHQRNDRSPLNTFLPDGSPAVAVGKSTYVTGKVSYQLSSSNRLILFYTRNTKLDGNKFDQFTPYGDRGGTTVLSPVRKAEWQKTWGNSVLTTAQVGHWKFKAIDWTYAPRNAVTTLDQRTLMKSGPDVLGGLGEDVKSPRTHARATLGWYRSDLFAGNHDFKFGVDYADAPLSRGYPLQPLDQTTGAPEGAYSSWVYNYQLIYQTGVPTFLNVYNFPNVPLVVSHYLSAYAQDSWTIARRLSLNLGLRYAHDDGFIPASCREAALPPAHVAFPAACYPKQQFNIWNTFAPRLSAAYDLVGNGKTVIKGGWGRFDHQRMHNPEMTTADPNTTTTVQYLWHDLNNDKLYQPGEVDLNVNGLDFQSQSGGSNTRVNPNEKEPRTDEFSASVEHELLPSFAVRMSAVYSRSDVYRTANILRPPDTYSVPITNRDPGPDGNVNTPDDPGTSITYWEYPGTLAGRNFEQFWLTNDPSAQQSFGSFEVAASKRFSNRWAFAASYSATKRNVPVLAGSTDSEFNSNTFSGPLNPNAEINTSDRNWESIGKISGVYRFPWDLQFSANHEYRLGYPWARQVQFRGGRTIASITLNVEPYGARRLPSSNQLDIALEKSFKTTQGHKMLVRASVFNVANSNTVLNLSRLSGVTFMRPSAIVAPRIAEMLVSYQF